MNLLMRSYEASRINPTGMANNDSVRFHNKGNVESAYKNTIVRSFQYVASLTALDSLMLWNTTGRILFFNTDTKSKDIKPIYCFK